MADDTYWNDEAEESQRKAQMIHCFEFIDKEYTRVWDTFDINDQQQFLDYMKERHNLHTVEKSVNKENPSLKYRPNDFILVILCINQLYKNIISKGSFFLLTKDNNK